MATTTTATGNLSPLICCVQQREEEQEAEQNMLKMEKEKEVARLRAQQERAQDKQAGKVSLDSYCTCAEMCTVIVMVTTYSRMP